MRPRQGQTRCAGAGAWVLAVAVAMGCAAKPPPAPPPVPTPAAAAPERWILIRKTAHTLSLYEGAALVKTYPVVLGKDPYWAKLYQGDHRTPEGEYHIVSKYVHPAWARFMLLDYPTPLNEEVYAWSAAHGDLPAPRGRPPGIGGAIGIHGTFDDSLNRRGVNWTEGCISLLNAGWHTGGDRALRAAIAVLACRPPVSGEGWLTLRKGACSRLGAWVVITEKERDMDDLWELKRREEEEEEQEDEDWEDEDDDDLDDDEDDEDLDDFDDDDDEDLEEE
jgi:hypothetical protein